MLIEGNILLKNTDMDIRFGGPIAPKKFERWWEAKAIDAIFEGIESLDDLFSLNRESGRWIERFVMTLLKRETYRLRDFYMREIYGEVTVNLAHLASALILAYVEGGRTEVSRTELDRTPDTYMFLPKLREELGFDRVRVENPVVVYANEIAPLTGARGAIEKALNSASEINERELAHRRFDDQLMRHAWCLQTYRQPRHAKINEMETATQSGAPAQR